MKRIIIAGTLLCLVSTSAFAARVYLKEGGYIEAKKVWRTPGKVHVLVNRDSLTTFSTAEVDLKKTFPAHKRKRAAKAAAPQAPAATSDDATGSAPQAGGKKGISLPTMPPLPERKPPTGQAEGTIRKQKREMQEKMNE